MVITVKYEVGNGAISFFSNLLAQRNALFLNAPLTCATDITGVPRPAGGGEDEFVGGLLQAEMKDVLVIIDYDTAISYTQDALLALIKKYHEQNKAVIIFKTT